MSHSSIFDNPTDKIDGHDGTGTAVTDGINTNIDTNTSTKKQPDNETLGVLSPEARKVLVHLIKYGVILARQKPKPFEALCRYQKPIEHHLADMYLTLTIDEKNGVAFVSQRDPDDSQELDEPAEEIATLITRRTLPLYDTLLLIVLRKHYQERETAGEQRITLDIERLETYLTPFLPLTNSSRMDRKKLSGALKKMAERKLIIPIRDETEERFELSPLLRYVVNAAFLEKLLTDYKRLANETTKD